MGAVFGGAGVGDGAGGLFERMGRRGIFFRTIMRGAGRIGGMRMGCWGYRIGGRYCVLRWRCGMGKDPILKERFFGLTGPQGNHGEDVKEYYYYLDSTPTHSYMKALYKYPQAAFPYEWLIAENGRRGRNDPEFELLDTGVFEGDRYFDVQMEYAKDDTEDILIRVTVFNRGPEAAVMTLLPTLWFRNTWTWTPGTVRPRLELDASDDGGSKIVGHHAELGDYALDV